VALLTLPPLGQRPALAAINRVRVIACRDANPTCHPAAFAFTPDGDEVFYVERLTGHIRRHTLATDQDIQWTVLSNVAGSTSDEQGVLGIALDPRWNNGIGFHWVYVFYTRQSPHQNRIIRMKKTMDGLVTQHLQTIPAASGYHNGGVIHFGPDGKLYAVTGEAHNPARAQDRDDPAGRCFGSRRPAGAPGTTPSRAARRSPTGTGTPSASPSTLRRAGCGSRRTDRAGKDEINWSRPGRNYGWGPSSDCPNTNSSGPNPVKPEKFYTPTIAPTGVAFCDGCNLGQAAENDLLLGAWNDGIIRRLVLNSQRNDVIGQQQVFNNPGGVMAVEAAPDGRIYFSDVAGIYRLVRT
jgi:aldose sugar dehydrogenase